MANDLPKVTHLKHNESSDNIYRTNNNLDAQVLEASVVFTNYPEGSDFEAAERLRKHVTLS